jgi:ubiquinone biosynthesis accessory factor UbiK
MTLNRNLLDDLSEQLSRLLPQAQAMSEEARGAARSALRQSLSKMDLVTREEFAAQQRALQRAEQKIAELEAMITALESRQAD